MKLKTMDPSIARSLLEGYEDILTPLAQADNAAFQDATCPTCGSQGCQKVFDPPRIALGPHGEPVIVSTPFGNGPLPKGFARCQNCETEFDPRSGIIRSAAQRTIKTP